MPQSTYHREHKARGAYKHPATDSAADMANDARQVLQTLASSAHGTSVAPRLRPKPAQQASTTPSLGLTLGTIPVNASPKNVISPIPAATVECDKFVANFNDKFLCASMPRYSPNPAEGESASVKITTPSTAVSPATLLSPFELESMSTSTTVSIRPRPTPLTSHAHHHMLSNSNSEKSLASPLSGSFTWNPFGDPSPFSPISTLTEDQLFGAEFDKLRLEGSQTSIVTSPEEMKSLDRCVPYWGGSQRNGSLSQAVSTGMIASTVDTLNGKDVQLLEEDPFGSAPFTLPKRLKQRSSSSKLASKLSDRWRNAVGSGQGGGKESLIESTPTEPCANGIDKRPGNGTPKESGLGELEKSVLISGGPKNLILDDLISSGEKASPSFIKLPLDDRNKYEKLNSNDITSDDSDSEFYPESLVSVGEATANMLTHGNTAGIGGGGGGSSAKKHSFKHFVESNIPEKLQAVYHKVDKSQIKNAPIVKKLRSKVVAHGSKEATVASKNASTVAKGRRKGKKHGKLDDTNAAEEGNASEDDDSIGSASDLRANDDFPEGDEIDPAVPPNANVARKRAPFNRAVFGGEGSVDDCISESIKTCGSSAYHAECESVTTNEDNSSRIVTRVRVKKRERLDSKHSVIDEDDSGEEDMIQGEKPLLLDDELDYESAADNNTSGEEVLMDPFSPEDEEAVTVKIKPHECLEDDSEADAELDPFAMAPFRKPFVAKRSSIVKFMPEVHPIPEHSTSGGGAAVFLPTDFITSTPLKPSEQGPVSRCNDIFELAEDHLMPLPEPLATPPLRVKSPNVRRPLFCSSEQYLISPTTMMATSPPSVAATGPAPAQQPPSPLVNIPNPTLIDSTYLTTPQEPLVTTLPTIDSGAVTLTHIIPHISASPAISLCIPPVPSAPAPVYASSSSSSTSIAMINHSQQQQYNQHVLAGPQSLSARRNYVNFSQIPSHNIACLSPDNNYVNFRADEEDDDDARNLKSDEYDDSGSNTVVKVSSKGFLTKKQKVKYNHLHEKTISTSGANHARDDGSAVTSTLGQKVKANVGGYRKVVPEGGGGLGRSKKLESFSQKPQKGNNSKSSSKAMGFSNMSFEDFPSDELGDEGQGAADGTRLTGTGTTGGGKLLKMAPFEVIRNEKMLLEAEKKFGSLKRRSNPFS